MKRGTIVVLAVAVAVLWWLSNERRKETEHLTDVVAQPALFEGFRAERVSSLRIDHLVRGVQILLERDAQGGWFLTEPLAYPAEAGLVRSLLDILSQSKGVVDEGADLAAVTLDEPLVVLEAVEVLGEPGDGTAKRTKKWRVEIGGVDLDERFINVRVPGHPHAPKGRDAAVMRVLRNLYNTLDRVPDDYRDTRITHLQGQKVDSIRRRGTLLAEGGQRVELDFDARRTGGYWRRTDSPAVRLDSYLLPTFARAASELRAFRFVDDAPRDLTIYWLDAPQFTIELADERGGSAKLLFACARGPGLLTDGSQTWYAMREGYPHVWEVEWRDLLLLVSPVELLVDGRLLQAMREDVLRVQFRDATRTLILEKDKDGWWVTETRTGESPARFLADPKAVEDLLATLEKAELGDCPADSAVPGDDAPSLSITTRSGELFGGRLGGEWRDPATGLAGRTFLRHGDEMLQLLGENVAALWERPLDELRSGVLIDVDEFLVDRILVRRGGAEQGYLRLEKEWQVGATGVVAPINTQILLGDLCHLQAAAWLEAGAPRDLQAPVEVHLRGRFAGRERVLVFGRSAAGDELCRLEGGETARLAPGLHDRLSALFQ